MTAALIISAGKTDHKEHFSPERQIGRISAIERIVLLLQMAGMERIVVVGDEEERPQKLVPSMNLVFLTASAGGEMLDSIRLGLDYLKEKCTEVLVAHVDVPMFSQETVRELLAAEGAVCVPCYHGKCGHPILLRKNCFADVLRYRGEGGLKGAVKAAGIEPQIVETEDAGILANIQSGMVGESLPEDGDMMKLRASVRFRVRKERIFYGPGIHQLLQLTEECGSLSNACQRMGISYSKGRKIVAVMEEQLGNPVLETRQGGKTGGYSRLTAEARDMMERYSAFQKEAEAAVQEIFQKHFSQMDEGS